MGWLAGPLAWLATFGSAALLALVWPETPLASMLGYLVVFSALSGVIILGASQAARAPLRWAQVGVVVGVGVGLAVVSAPLSPGWQALVGGLGALTAALTLGARLGAEVQFASYLWPLTLVALGADFWSVTTPEGVTQQLVAAGPEGGLNFVVLTLPVPGLGVSPVLGVGDVLYVALFLGAVRHLHLPVHRAIKGLAAGFALCLMGLLIIQVPLPALAFVAVGGAAGLGRHARPRRRELITALVFVGGFFALRAVLA